MDFESVAGILRKLRRRPWQTSILLFIVAVASVIAAWTTGYVQETGRRSAERQPVGTPDDLRVTYYRFEGATVLDRVLAGYGFANDVGFASNRLRKKGFGPPSRTGRSSKTLDFVNGGSPRAPISRGFSASC